VVGLLVIVLDPSDIWSCSGLASSTLATPSARLPLIGATVVIAALPLLEYLLFRMRARRTMPKVRDWMNGARVGREHHGLGDLPVLILG
jgi:hypothetical protein